LVVNFWTVGVVQNDRVVSSLATSDILIFNQFFAGVANYAICIVDTISSD